MKTKQRMGRPRHLNKEQEREMRKLRKTGLTYIELADKYGFACPMGIYWYFNRPASRLRT